MRATEVVHIPLVKRMDDLLQIYSCIIFHIFNFIAKVQGGHLFPYLCWLFLVVTSWTFQGYCCQDHPFKIKA